MTYQPRAYTQNTGTAPIQGTYLLAFDPSATTIQSSAGVYPQGAFVLNTVSGNLWYLKSYSTVSGITSANWVMISSGAGDITAILGTADEIAVNTTGGVSTISLPNAITAPGSFAATTSVTSGTIMSAGTFLSAGSGITAANGNVTINQGNLHLAGGSSKIQLNVGGAAPSAGIGTLTTGVLTITSASVTASSIVFPVYMTPEATPGVLSWAVTAGTLTITSTDDTDSTSTVAWFLIN